MSITLSAPRRSALATKATLLRGVAEPSRLLILEALRDGALNVSDIVAITGLSQSNTSNHLACLVECQLVDREPDGRYVRYRLRHPDVEQLLAIADRLLTKVGRAIAACRRTEAPVAGRGRA